MNLINLNPSGNVDGEHVAQEAAPSTSSAALRANQLLRTLAPQELSKLITAGRWVTFKQNEIVSHQGNQVDSILFIADGRAKAEISAPIRVAYKAAVNFLGPGDDIGLLSLVDGSPHSASVIALEDFRAVAVPFAGMRDYLSARPEWYRVLAEIAVSRLRTSGLWLQALI